MNKDVIYIDVDDDVTAIIGKIKKAKEKIVAVVPPKRVGTLQSAVNLRLLDRMARADKKQLVLITNNQALIALAANASIPVAKNLQSKPEIAEIPAILVDDSDDIIDGADLPVGDHASSLKVKDNTRGPSAMSAKSDVIETLDIDGEGDMDVSGPTSTAVMSYGSTVRKANGAKGAISKVKIPNFDTFRKRLFLGIGGGVLLIALLIWMFVFAPAATVIVTAGTSPTPVSATIKLGGTAATDFKTGVVKSVSQQEKKDMALEFDATGTGRVGEKATGTMTVTRTSVSSNPLSVPAGTTFTSGSFAFVSTQATTLDGTSVGPGGVVQDSATITVAASDLGAEYNLSTRAYQSSVGGISSQGSQMAGGSSREVKIVSADDIERAKGQLIGQSTDAEKKALSQKFVNGEKVIDSSFTVDRAEAVSVPAVNAEAPATGKARLTIATTYTLYAIASADLESYLMSSLKTQIDNENSQKVYSTGADKVGLSNFRKEGEALTVAITATGQIGPQIDEVAIKDQVKGKIYGEVQSALQSIDGVKDVDVKFSYFWVRTVPNNTDKIKIEFKLENE
ncbi:hypothetical protein H7200_01155 [Candidatus Saccharibacteria bacterium]|nr:hypothetical protein [Candidatus Saccharibacteria bacterium]